jgi:hypothetical protein
MAILGKVAGTMLKDNLVRNGVDLILDGNLMYWDVANRRVGIGTTSPGNTFVANGSSTLSNIYINSNTITALTGNLVLTSLTGNVSVNNKVLSYVATPIGNLDATNKAYVDAAVSAVSFPNLNISDGTTTTNVVLSTETLLLQGTANQITVTNTGDNTMSFSLPTNVAVTGNLTAGNVRATGSGGQIQGYLTGAIGSNVANTGAFTTLAASSTLNVSGTASFAGTLTAATLQATTIGNAGAAFTGATSTLTSTSVANAFTTTYGGQFTGYLTGAIGANVANTGAFTTITASSTLGVTGTANFAGTINAATVQAATIGNAGAAFSGLSSTLTGTSVANAFATTYGGQFTGYLTGPIGANVANTGVFTTLTATSGYNGAVNGPFNGTIGAVTPNSASFTTANASTGFFWSNNQVYNGYMTISEIDSLNSNVLSNIVPYVTSLRFDRAYGLFVNDLGSGNVRVSLGSSFSTWIVSGQGNLKAVGDDKVEFIAGAGIKLTTNNSSIPQSLTITSTGNLASANIGNIYIHDNTITAINTDGNISIAPDGNGVVTMNTTTALQLPAGNNVTRPLHPTKGMIRFNTVEGSLEFYDGFDWLPVSATTTTTIVSDTFTGNGTQTNFTLTQASTTGGTLVTINGVIQIPDVSYSVSGTNLSFIEAPLSTDVIEARLLVTTSSITSLHVGNSSISFDSAANSYAIIGTVGDVSRVRVGAANTEVYNTLVVSNNILWANGNGFVGTGDSVGNSANVSLVQNVPTIISSFPKATYRTAKCVVSISDFAGSKFQSAELLVNHDGASSTVTTYAVNTTGGTNFVTFASSVSGSNVIIQANSSSSSSYCNLQTIYVPV